MNRTITILIALAFATCMYAETAYAKTIFVSEPETTIAIGGSPWRVYLDVGGEVALDRDGDGQPDRFAQQFTADQAAKVYLRENGGGEAFTGLGGVAVFRHTAKGRTVVIGDPDPPTDLPVEPPFEPDPIGTSIFIDAVGGPSRGDDVNSGLNPGAAVETIARAKEIAHQVITADPAEVVIFRLRRGDNHGEFGRVWGRVPSDPEWLGIDLKGTADNYVLITGYGDGERPIIVGELTVWTQGARVEIRGIEHRGGKLLCKSRHDGLRITDCYFIVVENTVGERFEGFEFTNNTVRDVVAYSGHRSGVFISSCDGWVFDDNVLSNCGRHEDGSDDVYNHGLYASGNCGPATSVSRNVAINCAGTGLQVRPAGNCRDNFSSHNGWVGMTWGLTLGAITSDKPGTGEFTGNVVYQTERSHAVEIGNLKDAKVSGNTGVSKVAAGLAIKAYIGGNSHGGAYFGLNNVSVTGNAFRGSGSHGGVTVSREGWVGPVPIKGNKLDGGVVKWSNFVDANNVVEIGPNEAADLSALTGPTLTDEWAEKVIAREITVEQLREQYRADD